MVLAETGASQWLVGVASFTLIAASLVAASLAFAGCTTSRPHQEASPAAQRASINSGVESTLSRLYQTAPQSRDLVKRARGVLVFPDVLKGGFIVGAEYGRGALLSNGKTQAYYSSAGGSIGFQAGAQSKAVVVLFMTDEALRNFQQSQGWEIGVDATVAVANIGANGSIDSNTIRQPVMGFVMNNAGLMAGVSLDGAKINRLNLQ